MLDNTAKTAATTSWAAEVLVSGETKWSRNALRFATEAEAFASAQELMMRWFAVREIRAAPASEPVNYRFVDGRNVPIEA